MTAFRTFLFTVAALSAACLAGSPIFTAGPALAEEKVDAKLAGARFGQALGSELICYGLKSTEKAKALPAKYTGDDAAAFSRESDKVLAAWREAATCKNAKGPNECRLLFEASCSAAFREIGPNGTSIPGLVEQKTK